MEFKPCLVTALESADKGLKTPRNKLANEPVACLACNVENFDSDGCYVLGRFIETLDRKKFVYCDICEKLVEDSHDVLTEMKRDKALCKKCWDDTYPTWAEMYSKLQKRQPILKAKTQVRKRAKYMTFRRDDFAELCRLAGDNASYEQVEEVARREDYKDTTELQNCTRSLNWMIAYENRTQITASPMNLRMIDKPS